jgi:hypothetical protein
MIDLSDPTPIATAEQYKAALLAVRDRMKDTHLAMLQTHCRAPEHAISAASLAEAVGVTSASHQYGTFARWIADILNYNPNQKSGGSFRWWRALAIGRPGAKETVDGQSEWIMRPELVAVLQAMKWA